MKSVLAIGITLASLTSVGCLRTGPEETTWKTVGQDSMSGDQNAQRDRALAARDAMASRLKGRLMEVLGSDDPATAIVVCAEDAPQIAADVSQEHGVSIGRTSFRLRNPKNTPPVWTSQLVADRIDEPIYLSDGRKLGALLPIRLEVACLTCHGPEDAIPQEVKDALVKHYPEDQATGFRKGDLRGWFWVEVPAADR
jgi:hypothetical protein